VTDAEETAEAGTAARPVSAPAAEAAAAEPYAATAEAVALSLGVDPATGLTTATAAARLVSTGPNQLEPPKRTSLLATIIDAATEPFVVVLAVAGVLALLLGEVRDGVLVLIGLGPIVGADVVTAYRGERALEELRAAAAPRAHVRRDGSPSEIAAADLVPGDVVRLRVGDVVPADLRVSRSSVLTVDRSILTGESLPDELRTDPDPAGTTLPERRSMAHAGTAVVMGNGEGIVVATGARTELGRIATALGPRDRGRSPLQRELDRLVRILLVVAIGLVALTTGLGLLRGASLGAAVLAGISAAIAAIPEEPPVLLAVVLGLGAYRLLRRGVLVRRLNAQETLGSIDLIVTDKTGTLTQNRLSLELVIGPEGGVVAPGDAQTFIVDAIRAEEDAWHADVEVRRGSFTTALVAASGSTAIVLDPRELIEARAPGPEAPYSWTRARRNGTVEELALGAPEAVLSLSAHDSAETWRQVADTAAGAGKRLLLLARRTEGGPWRPRALLSFADTLRPGIPAALNQASEAGIQTIVVTGDHPATAAAIAREAGLRGGRVLTGEQITSMSDAELESALPGLEVVARATPDQKLRLVLAAKRSRRTVAVTGDGVNDAPALQRADVAVAMGSGTAVAREAADLVLGDDSFATLMDGLREGRRIVANVQKGLVFLTSTHVALLGFIFIATVAGFGQPLLPIQILWLELFIDLAASVAFEREPAEPDIMRRPPRPRDVPLLTRALLGRPTAAGSVTAVAALALMLWHGGGLDHARWLAFSALVYGQLVRAYANRSLVHPIRTLRPNRFLATACLAGGIVQFVIPLVPPLADAFRATRLDALDLGLIALVALLPAVVAEVARSRGQVWIA
jgi:Ca2+-transporting ATPase